MIVGRCLWCGLLIELPPAGACPARALVPLADPLPHVAETSGERMTRQAAARAAGRAMFGRRKRR